MSTAEQVLSPVSGLVVALEEIPDPVFAQGMVGGGVGVRPAEDAQRLSVHAPLEGRLVKAHPHAFILQHQTGAAVLVHVGLDTVGLDGRGFHVHAAQGAALDAGEPLVDVELTVLREAGLDPICPVVILDTASDAVTSPVLGQQLEAGAPLFGLPVLGQ